MPAWAAAPPALPGQAAEADKFDPCAQTRMIPSSPSNEFVSAHVTNNAWAANR